MRFKKYDTNWDRKKLSDYVKKITRKNSNNVIKNVICNSAQNGLIPQLDFFDKEIANNENTAGYYIISNGDFVYNPRKSLSAPYGPVNIYKYDSDGIVSPLYLCFSVDDCINKSFLLQRFKSPCWYRYIYLNGDSGARHDRVSIKDEVFLSQPINLPNAEEQAVIAEFLEKIDERISVQNKIISKYETLIKGLKNQLYSRKARFTSHNKIPFPKWEKKQLSEILSISTEKNGSQYSKEKVLSVSDEYGVVNQIKFQGKSFAGQDISNYKVVKSGQIIYTRSPLAAKPFGIIKIVGNEIGIVSPLYIVNTVNNGYDALFVFYLFDTPQSTNNYLKPLVRVGAKHTMNISNDEWLSGTVIIPCLEEQKMIAGVLQSIDKKISFEKKVLEILKEQKTYLLSKMFI